jgi:hypothetical protein
MGTEGQKERARRLQALIDAQTDPAAPRRAPRSPRELTDKAAAEEKERARKPSGEGG